MPSKPSSILETAEYAGSPILVRTACTEFTSLSPDTGQPDFGVIFIEMIPYALLLELRSLKAYLWSFRGKEAFHENIVDEIARTIDDATTPCFLRVVGRFALRGGLHTSIISEIYPNAKLLAERRSWKIDHLIPPLPTFEEEPPCRA